MLNGMLVLSSYIYMCWSKLSGSEVASFTDIEIVERKLSNVNIEGVISITDNGRSTESTSNNDISTEELMDVEGISVDSC